MQYFKRVQNVDDKEANINVGGNKMMPVLGELN